MTAVPETAAEPGPIRRLLAGRWKRRGSVAQLASASYLTIGLAIISSPIIARALGPAARGEYAAIFVYATALTTVLAVGFPPAIVHRLVNGMESPDRLVGAVLRFSALLALPAIVLAVGIVSLALGDLSGASRYLAIFAIAMAPISVFGWCMQAFLTSSGALGPLSLLRAAPLILNFAGVIVLVSISRFDLASYLLLTIAILLLVTAAAWYFVPARPEGHAPLRPLIRFGLGAYPGTFATMLNVQLDQLLAPLIAPAQSGFYAIAISIASVPSTMAEAVGVRATGSVLQPEEGFLAPRAERYLRLTLLLAVVGCVVLGCAAPVVVPLAYGQDFSGVVVPLLLLLPGAIANAGSLVVGPCLLVNGRPAVSSFAELTAVAITGLGLAYALPRYGIAGAAAVSSVAYAYRFAVQMYVLYGYGVRAVIPRLADARELLRALPRPRSVRT